MLQRFGITLADNNTGVEKQVFTSRKGAVSVKLLTKVPERLAVLATPMPSFDQDSDYIVALISGNGEPHFETIHGTPPAWVIEGAQIPAAAHRLAVASQF